MMTTPVQQQHDKHDDNDSLYDHPLVKPPTKTAQETVLPNHHATHVDRLLDSEETPPPSNSSSATSIPTSTSPHFDERFDSDENQISTSSSSSSSSTTTIPERPSLDTIPVVSSLDSPPANKPAASFLSRASATFYKAFRKKKSSPVTPPPHDAPATLAQLFDAQIATLRSARTGFVDLALVTPMTHRTLDAVHDAAIVLRDFGETERMVTKLKKHVEISARDADADITAKERILVEAKVRLAEVSEEVDRLRHELRRVRKVLADPRRVDRRKIAEVRREALVCLEARRHAETRLVQKKSELETERTKLDGIEKDYRDIEGDWA